MIFINVVGYGDTSSTVEVRISKYDYLGYMLCVADAEDHPEVAVKQYDFDFGELLIIDPWTITCISSHIMVNVQCMK